MEVLRLGEESIAIAAQKAAAVLVSGGIVLYPTDTLYGLAVDATNADALARLRDLKGREKDKPISIVVPSVGMIEEYAELIERTRTLAEKHLPGALTLVLRAKDTIPTELTKDGSIGIRIPNDPFCLALAQAFQKPFTATSANVSGEETLDTVGAILAQFGEKASMIALAIDDGPRAGGIPSTIVNEKMHVLREGAIPREALRL